MSLIKDIYTRVWVVIVTGTNPVLYYSMSRQQCLDYMNNVGKYLVQKDLNKIRSFTQRVAWQQNDPFTNDE